MNTPSVHTRSPVAILRAMRTLALDVPRRLLRGRVVVPLVGFLLLLVLGLGAVRVEPLKDGQAAGARLLLLFDVDAPSSKAARREQGLTEYLSFLVPLGA